MLTDKKRMLGRYKTYLAKKEKQYAEDLRARREHIAGLEAEIEELERGD